eukprot:967044-Amphidinium_carterae.1
MATLKRPLSSSSTANRVCNSMSKGTSSAPSLSGDGLVKPLCSLHFPLPTLVRQHGHTKQTET